MTGKDIGGKDPFAARISVRIQIGDDGFEPCNKAQLQFAIGQIFAIQAGSGRLALGKFRAFLQPRPRPVQRDIPIDPVRAHDAPANVVVIRTIGQHRRVIRRIQRRMAERAVSKVKDRWRGKGHGRHPNQRQSPPQGPAEPVFLILCRARHQQENRQQHQPLRVIAEILKGHIKEPRNQQQKTQTQPILARLPQQDHPADQCQRTAQILRCTDDGFQRCAGLWANL